MKRSNFLSATSSPGSTMRSQSAQRESTVNIFSSLNEGCAGKASRKLCARSVSTASCCICRRSCAQVRPVLDTRELSKRSFPIQLCISSPAQIRAKDRRRFRKLMSRQELCPFLWQPEPWQNRSLRFRRRRDQPRRVSARSNHTRCFFLARPFRSDQRSQFLDRHKCTTARRRNRFSDEEIGTA